MEPILAPTALVDETTSCLWNQYWHRRQRKGKDEGDGE